MGAADVLHYPRSLNSVPNKSQRTTSY